MKYDDLEAQHIFPINTDLIMAANLPREIEKDEDEGWQPYFLPKDFVWTNIGINVDAFKLDEQTLFDHAVTVSNLRKQFRDKAEAAAKEIGL